jgi:hypothetical protein
MDPSSERLGDLDERSVLGVGDDSTGDGFSNGDRVVREHGLGDARRLRLLLLLLFGRVGNDDEPSVLVLGDDEEAVEMLAELDGGLDLGHGDASVVGEVRHGEKGFGLGGLEGEEEVFGVESGDDAGNDLGDFDAGGGNGVCRSDGAGECRLDGSDESGGRRVSVDDLDLDGLADEEGLFETGDERIAAKQEGKPISNSFRKGRIEGPEKNGAHLASLRGTKARMPPYMSTSMPRSRNFETTPSVMVSS